MTRHKGASRRSEADRDRRRDELVRLRLAQDAPRGGRCTQLCSVGFSETHVGTLRVGTLQARASVSLLLSCLALNTENIENVHYKKLISFPSTKRTTHLWISDNNTARVLSYT